MPKSFKCCRNIGLNVTAMNFVAFKSLDTLISSPRPQYIFDYVHLFKSVRNNFLNRDVQLPADPLKFDEKTSKSIASWETLIAV